MATLRRPRPAGARGLLAGVTACAALGLAACGSAVAGNGAHPGPSSTSGHAGRQAPAAAGSAAVCRDIHTLQRVVITRAPGPMTSYMHEFMPLGLTVSKPPVVRGLAATLCSLPAPPPMLHCPVDFGLSYRLMFASFRQVYPPVTMDLTGCRTVRGLGHPRWWARAPQAWTAFRHALANGRALLLPVKSGAGRSSG